MAKVLVIKSSGGRRRARFVMAGRLIEGILQLRLSRGCEGDQEEENPGRGRPESDRVR